LFIHVTDLMIFNLHGSRYDFNENPSLKEIQKLSASAEACIQHSRALFVNGYVFDELAPSVVLAAMRCAQEAGGRVFFDPGPRVYSFFRKSPQHVSVLEELLDVSDVLLLTDDEVCLSFPKNHTEH
jgi:sugar/nucleoside kinase (ribokinase family)